jgi:aminoglycoside phosphotransferase (APT) family kinase protein
MAWLKPETDEVRVALRDYVPHLADAPIEFLSEGWEFWAFTAGDHVLRFPMRDRGSVWKLGDRSSRESLQIERALGPELAEALFCDVAIIDVFGESGPNQAPFAGHRLLSGEVVMSPGAPKPSPTFGRDFGRLLRELRAFPAQRALDLGVPLFDGQRLRDDRIRHYEDVIRRAFPLLSCEARTHVERVYETYLNDAASFDFEPVFVHTDLAVNTLIDPDGGLCGLIDLGDAAVSSPALDLWLPLFGFAQLGIADQIPACLAEAGIEDHALQRMTPELTFLDVRYPLLGILHGLSVDDAELTEEGIRELNALVPFGIECA